VIAEAQWAAYISLAAFSSGIVVLIYMVARQLLSRPLVRPVPQPFRPVDAPGMAALGIGLFFGQAMLGILLMEGGIWGAVALFGGLNVGIFAYLFVSRRVTREPGTARKRIGLGLLVLWAGLPVIYGAFLVIARLGGDAGSQALVRHMQTRQEGWAYLAAFAVLVAPVIEEVAFRGLLYPALRRGIGVRGAVIVTAVLFGLVHGQVNVIMPLTVLGVFLAYLIETTGSILSCIAAHAAFNFLTISQIIWQ